MPFWKMRAPESPPPQFTECERECCQSGANVLLLNFACLACRKPATHLTGLGGGHPICDDCHPDDVRLAARR